MQNQVGEPWFSLVYQFLYPVLVSVWLWSAEQVTVLCGLSWCVGESLLRLVGGTIGVK